MDRRHFVFVGAIILCASRAIAYDFDVADYGAYPDDNLDDTAALNKVIDLIRSNKTAGRIVFHPGTYKFNYQLTLYKPCNNITIEGNGATLLWSLYKLGWYILECKGITFQNLYIDYDPLPFTGGRVINVNNTDKSFDVAIAAPHKAYEKVVQGYLTYDLDRKRFGEAGSANETIRSIDVYQLTSTPIAQIIQTGPSPVLRAFSDGKIPSALLGQNVVVRHQIYKTNCFQATKSADISLLNVTLWTCPGMGFVAMHTTNVKLDNLQIRKKEGRWMSVAADGIHLTNVRGTVAISNSYLEGMGDDALNMHNNMLAVRELNATHVGLSKSNVVYVGDVIEFGRPSNPLIPYLSATITSVFELDTLNVTYVTFDTDIAQINLFDTAVIQTMASAHIYNVTVSKNRARGFQMNNRMSLIEDCTLDQTTGPAVLIACEKTGEGNCAHNLMFRNNLITDCNYGTAWRQGVVYMFASANSTAQPAGVFQNITFESNSFEGPVAQSVFFVGSARGVVIRNNSFDNARQSPNGTIAVICSSEDVTLECNQLTLALTSNTTWGLQYSSSCPAPSGNVDMSRAFDTCHIESPASSPWSRSAPQSTHPGGPQSSGSPLFTSDSSSKVFSVLVALMLFIASTIN